MTRNNSGVERAVHIVIFVEGNAEELRLLPYSQCFIFAACVCTLCTRNEYNLNSIYFVACFHRLVWISLRCSSGGEFQLYCVMVCPLYLLHCILLFRVVTWQFTVQHESVACMNGERAPAEIIMLVHKLCVLCGVILPLRAHVAALICVGRHFAQASLLQWSFASGRASDWRQGQPECTDCESISISFATDSVSGIAKTLLISAFICACIATTRLF